MAIEYAWRDESFQKRQICLDEGKVRIATAEEYAKKIYDKMLYHHDKKISTLFGRARPSFADQLARKTRSGRKEVFESLSESLLHEKP